MEFAAKLKGSIPVINLDTKPPEKRKVPMFPNTMRAVIAGSSGAGKTNVVLTILLHRKPLTNIYLCCKTADQAKYKLLSELVEGHNKSKKKIGYSIITDIENLPLPEKIENNSVIIFDDILTEDQDPIANYFLRGRHRNISCFYLTQSYTKIPKKSGIRDNLNFLILFKLDSVNVRQIYYEYISGLTDYATFKKMCDYCWREKFNFITIDLDNNTFKKNFEYSLSISI